MSRLSTPKWRLETLPIHVGEGEHPHHAHVAPIFQTSTFGFPDVETGAALFRGQAQGYIYSRLNNPNHEQLAAKIAALEAYDLAADASGEPPAEARVFGSGMAAIAAAVLARVGAGGTVITQQALYGGTYGLFFKVLPRLGIRIVTVPGHDLGAWEQAFRQHPEARLAYVETPTNPTMALVDIRGVAEIAHAHDVWVVVDNTFATPYCQRPLSLGADVVVHSTTKYLSGHGFVIGGAVVSRHRAYIRQDVQQVLKSLGAMASPFDAWLTAMGMKTFALRMERHCANAMRIARYLEGHPKVARVFYPGLPSFPDHDLARRQMHCFGGMLSFELKGGYEAGVRLLNRVRLMTLAVSLGNVDTLIQHPASMTHAGVPKAEREKMGITDGLVRLSVGIEHVEDLIADLEQALEGV